MTQTIPTKYVYLDVVDFTKDRSVEAQADVVEILNEIVRNVLKIHDVAVKRRILIPTGDGICIALLDISHFDIHIGIALDLLNKIKNHSEECDDESRRFSIRIGINENIDNIVIDINRRRNLAGGGINLAQRVMSIADGGQVLVSQPVYEILKNREKYMKLFRHYAAKGKHGDIFSVYQLVDDTIDSLNTDIPAVFQVKKPAPKKLTRLQAYYLAHALHKKAFVQQVARKIASENILVVMFYFMAIDSLGHFNATEFDVPLMRVHRGSELSLAELYDYYNGNDYWVMCYLKDLITKDLLSPFEACFVAREFGKIWVVPSEHGIQKLKQEFPDIYKTFGIEQLSD